MSAPLFLLDPGDLAEAAAGVELVLDGPEGRHAADVLRLQTGEPVLLADGSGVLVHGRVVAAGRGRLDVQVDQVEWRPAPEPRLVLVQALAKGDRDLLAVEAATEIGVDEVVPWQAGRSISRWKGERAARHHRKWEQAARAAAKQARRVRVPTIAPLADQRALRERVAAADLALVLHEEGSEPVATVPLPDTGEVVLVVGPEGGLAPEETADLADAGARVVRLGPTVLRTSTAGPAALAVLSARERWT